MAFADVEAKLTITGFSAADEATIKAAIQQAYDGSATAKQMFDDWIAVTGNTLTVDFVAGAFQAYPSTGSLEIDLAFLADASYINNNGKAVADTPVTAITHEFVHAILGKLDNWDNVSEYKGDTVKHANLIFGELGIDLQNSYIAYDETGNILTVGRDYTDGAEIDRAQASDNDWNSGPAGNSRDLLIGGASANILQGGAGNDFLYGAGGDDTLDGGDGTGDTVVLTGKPTDYDIRLNTDGTWTSRHVRGDADEGTDTFANLEKVHFITADQSFNLAKSGLTFQTDFSFVIDRTGSMFDDIAAVKTAATGVLDALFNNDTIDARVNVVTYGDTTIGEPTNVVLSFTDHDDFADRKAAAVSAINSISTGGGGDFPESAFDGLLKALNGSAGDWRVGAGVKKVALFTDATAKDTHLLPAVLAYALDIGATITSSRSTPLGTEGVVDTFTLSYGEDTSGRSPNSDGHAVISAPLAPIIVTPPFGPAVIQVTTIFISGFTTPDPNLASLSDDTGGSVLLASSPSQVVERLLEVITSVNYTISADRDSVTEGDSGATTVTFTISRDRSEEAATVELITSGTANAADIDGTVPATLEFAEGEISKTFTIDILGDTLAEPDETFSVAIGAISEASTVITGIASVQIINDDGVAPPPSSRIVGTPGDDELTGTAGDDNIFGRDGKDKIWGGEGNDRIKGEGGNDQLWGHNGDDVMHGGLGKDILRGENGEDRLYGEEGDDRLLGGHGNDRLFGGDGFDFIVGGGGDDVLYGDNPSDGNNAEGWADIFQFDRTDGNDKVMDFEVGLDKIQLVGDGDYTLAALGTKHTVLTWGATTVTFHNALVTDSDIVLIV